jgi:hypothetical protein
LVSSRNISFVDDELRSAPTFHTVVVLAEPTPGTPPPA